MSVHRGDRRFGSVYRLKKTDEFSSVFAFRHAIRVWPFRLFFRSNSRDSARLGVVVGKRFVRRAVRRNRIKRLIREVFRVVRADLPLYDIVVRVENVLGQDDARLREGLVQLFCLLAKDTRGL